MRLFYVTNTRIPSERASAYQVMQMCAAFAARNVHVDLLYPRRRAYGQWGEIDDTFAYYGVPAAFAMQPVPCVDPIKTVTIDHPRLNDTPLPRLSHYLQTGTFALKALRRVLAHRAGVCYSRDITFLSLLRAADPQRRWRLFYEAHTTPATPWSLRQARWLAPRLDGSVTITESIRRFYMELGVPADSVLTAPDGVDLARYAQLPAPAAARARLDLPSEGPLICYTGQLYRWKGVHTLIAAMAGAARGHAVPGGRRTRRARGGAGAGTRAGTHKRQHNRSRGAGNGAALSSGGRRARAAEHGAGSDLARAHLAAQALRIHGRRPAHRRLGPAFFA